MRLKQITVAALFLLIAGVFQQVTVAQEAPPARTIPIISKGFGGKLSPDGKTLITIENILLTDLKEVDPTLLPMRVIDISTGKELGQLSGFSDYASDVAFTSDSKRLISVHMNGDISIWDMATLKVIKTFQTPLLGYLKIKLFPDDNRILVLLQSGTPAHFYIIDPETGAITQTLGIHFDSFLDFQNNYTKLPALGDVQIASFSLSSDGRLLATSSLNDEVGLRTTTDNQYQVVRNKSEQVAQLNIRQLIFTPNGKSLIYYDRADMQTHVWDIASKSEKAALTVGSETLTLSPDGMMLAWATQDKDGVSTISVAPLDAPDKATVVLTLPKNLHVVRGVTFLSFTPDGKQLVVGGFFADDKTTNQIYVLDVPS